MKSPTILTPVLAMINQRPQRERMMILLTSLTCVLMSGMQGIDILGKKIKLMNNTVTEKSESISKLNTELSTLQIEYSIDPNSNLKQQQTQLQSDFDKTEKELELMMNSLVEPKKMVKVIRDLFINQTELRLLQLKNLPPKLLTTESLLPENTVTTEKKGAPELYRHALLISFEGNFFSVVTYLKKLETLKWRFYWKSIDYQVSEYPNAKITLELHTFSREKGVLGV